MSVDKNHKKLFEKYLKGELSEEEAHAFERDLLNDPFTQEALEGVEEQDPKQVFADIEKLQSKIIVDKSTGYNWMKIAAIGALLIVSSIAFWLILGPLADTSELAMETTEVAKEEIEKKTDLEAPAEIAKADIPEVKKSDSKTNETSKSQSLREEPAQTASAKAKQDSEISEEEIAENSSIEITEEAQNGGGSSGLAGSTAKKEVIQEIETSIIVVQTSEAATNLEESADAERFFDDESKNEFMGEADEVSDQALSIQSNESSISTLAETPIKAKKSAAARSTGLTSKPPGIAKSASPEIGEEAYQNYLEEHLVFPEAAKANQIEGNVILRITISPIGEIQDISIRKSLGYGCDEEAIRLVKDGPKWTPAVENGTSIETKVRVEVTFKLD